MEIVFHRYGLHTRAGSKFRKSKITLQEIAIGNYWLFVSKGVTNALNQLKHQYAMQVDNASPN